MAIQLERNRRQDHKSEIWLNIDGRTYRAWLSPDLIHDGSPERTLILVNLTPSEVPPSYRGTFQKFSEAISMLDQRRVASAKRAVVKIANQEWRDDLYHIAIHKMGPVPVFALKGVDLQPASLNGRKAIVAVFPRTSETQVRRVGRGSRPGSTELFYALIAVDASLFFRAYFEDIFGHFKDISDKLNLVDCMHRVKAIREVLTQSIESKLQVLTPSIESWGQYQRNKLPEESHEMDVCSWFDRHVDVIAEAIYLSCLTYRCISEFLEMLGILCG